MSVNFVLVDTPVLPLAVEMVPFEPPFCIEHPRGTHYHADIPGVYKNREGRCLTRTLALDFYQGRTYAGWKTRLQCDVF